MLILGIKLARLEVASNEQWRYLSQYLTWMLASYTKYQRPFNIWIINKTDIDFVCTRTITISYCTHSALAGTHSGYWYRISPLKLFIQTKELIWGIIGRLGSSNHIMQPLPPTHFRLITGGSANASANENAWRHGPVRLKVARLPWPLGGRECEPLLLATRWRLTWIRRTLIGWRRNLYSKLGGAFFQLID